MHVVGTAGHVDHGKSALVRALTGTDPDRWLEERVRGMTLDLGFAHLRFDDGTEAGIVDVPGHERFVHNMLAGAAGMDVLLLVVAANAGPRPQTLEHLAILEYLNVRSTIVVLTKADLADADERALASALVRDATRGTFAADAPHVAVSSTTGEGLATLRDRIGAALRALPEREPNAPPYLPIDRVFALPGHGTIVTGTLMQGRIAPGDALVLSPASRPVRVRGVHVFGEKRRLVAGGTRVALNLPSIATSDARRGDVVASAQFSVATTIDVRFRPLVSALAILRRKTTVRAYLGSAELLGTLAFERVPESAGEIAATLRLRGPTLVVPGSAFVVRRLSPKTLLGGGTVDGVAGTTGSDVVADSSETIVLLAALRKMGLDGADAARAGGLANILAERADQVLNALADDGRVLRLKRPAAYVDREAATDAFERVRALLATGESDRPWSIGSTSIALARELALVESKLVRVLAAFVDDGALAYRNGYYATPSFVPQLMLEQRAFFAEAFPDAVAAANAPLALEALRGLMRQSSVNGLGAALETLYASGAMVKIDDAIYRGDQLARIRALLERLLRAEKQLTVSAFREAAQTSRKYAVPLLEWFDATGVTVRSGDVRFLRLAPARTSDEQAGLIPDAPR